MAAIAAFTAASFNREGKLDEGALDEGLTTARQVTRKMKVQQLWIMKRLAARRALTPLEARVWSR